MGRMRLLALLAVVLLLLGLQATALAAPPRYTAGLATTHELHEVVGSDARGTLHLGINPDGTAHFILKVQGLSGAPTGAHFHGPADATQTAGVVVTLCGGPAPAVVATCPFEASTASLVLEGDFDASYVQGMTPAEAVRHLHNGLLYVNVHTALNPAGEARGQLLPH